MLSFKPEWQLVALTLVKWRRWKSHRRCWRNLKAMWEALDQGMCATIRKVLETKGIRNYFFYWFLSFLHTPNKFPRKIWVLEKSFWKIVIHLLSVPKKKQPDIYVPKWRRRRWRLGRCPQNEKQKTEEEAPGRSGAIPKARCVRIVGWIGLWTRHRPPSRIRIAQN